MGDSVEVRKRKVRSDKKTDVKPTIPIELKDVIYRIGYVIDTPVKDVCEAIVIDGMDSKKVIGHLAQNFRRDVRLHNTIYFGDLERPSLQRREPLIKSERITLRLKTHDFENIATLAFALGVTPSRATGLLLDASIRNSDFINAYLERHLAKKLDERRMKELRIIIKYLNRQSPYAEKISWMAMLTYLYSEVKDSASTFHESISEYIDRWR